MKLMLACALAHTPDLLILDESTSGLDPVVRSEILDLLREYLMEGNVESSSPLTSRAIWKRRRITSPLSIRGRSAYL